MLPAIAVCRPGGVKTLLMLDEFKMLGYLSAVENAFSLAAGYKPANLAFRAWRAIETIQMGVTYWNRAAF